MNDQEEDHFIKPSQGSRWCKNTSFSQICQDKALRIGSIQLKSPAMQGFHSQITESVPDHTSLIQHFHPDHLGNREDNYLLLS